MFDKFKIITTIFLLILISCGKEDISMKNRLASRTDKLDNFFNTLYQRDQFNGNVLLAEKGKVYYKKSFGFADFETSKKLDENSIFDMGSIAKQFTAMCIMMLQEQHKLNYEDKITKYLPELPLQNITIRHLLTHTSGLPDWVEFKNSEYDPQKVFNNDDIISIFIDEKSDLLFNPGEKWQYSNLGYLFLGEIVERISNMTLNAFMKKNIFEPLKMKNTNHQNYLTAHQMKNKTNGYFYYRPSGRPEIAIELEEPGLNYPRRNATEGLSWIYTTTSDLFKWDRALYKDKLVSKETIAQAFSPVKLNNSETYPYGFGWFLDQNSKGEKLVLHAGGLPGYVSKFIRNIDADKTIIILSNKYNILLSDIERITDELIKLADNKQYEIPKLSIAKELYKIVNNETDLVFLIKKVKEMKTDSSKYFIDEKEMQKIGTTLLFYGSPDDAIKILKLNTYFYPKSATAAISLGKAYLKTNNNDLAREYFKKALSIEPDNKDIIKLLKEMKD